MKETHDDIPTPSIVLSPWQRHCEASPRHPVTHVSPDGHSTFEECETCGLCWLLPDALNRNKYPITVYRYPIMATVSHDGWTPKGDTK